MSDVTVAVVGGGITGLAAAWELAGAGAQVTLFEANERLGGRIRSEEVGGRPVDVGPDAFLARVPDAVALCEELGLAGELVHPAAEGAALWTGGRLRRLPAGLVMGAPTRPRHLVELVRAGLLSPLGAGRAALDLVLPVGPAVGSAAASGPAPAAARPATVGGDPSVADVVGRRLGREAYARLVDPLVSAIHAGPSSLLSARAAAPQLAAAGAGAGGGAGGLMRGLRRVGAPAEAAGGGGGVAPAPLFASVRPGLGRLVERLEEALRARGVALRLGAPVSRLPDARAVVLATPAPAAAGLVEPASPNAAVGLRAIDYASVALAVLVYPAAALARRLDGTGFLVPASEGRLLTACSFGSSKWPHWAEPGEVVLRASAGRWGDERALGLADTELTERLHGELVAALGLREEPRAVRVARWPAAFPQYRPGHLERVADVEAALARDLPGVELAGAGYRGVGIAACIAQGRAAARRALVSLARA